MIPYSGLLFFYVMGLLLLPAVVLGVMEKPIKHYGLVFTIAMLVFVFWGSGQVAALVMFYLWQTLLCMIFFRMCGRTRLTLRVFVTLSILPILAVKIGEVFAPLGFLQLLGISYMTFRCVQVLLDTYDGKLTQLRLIYLSYFLLFFPSVSAGPIDRCRRFFDDLDRSLSREEYLALMSRGIWRLTNGALWSIVISGLIHELWLEILPAQGFLATISYMYGYTLFLFFNFAGYTSMAIGTAYILGVRLPENFDMPFLSVDMKDFWSRWHMSLSLWLRDYVYNRFVKSCLKAKRFKTPRTASYIGYFLTMTLMGAWHGFTPAFLVYGAYHGVLLAINEALDLRWKRFRQIKRGRGQVVCAVVTFHLFSFGLLIFSGRIL